ncbi:2'-5' RNA ligase family protein [Cellulomonas sp. HZM]|uniref:2'-5' RNA ligase family protein n=1 Tax=Cellulomonas sp. HZM TaxID=1454010 RepID=UPI000493027C|nr:2'-5' RNA ligase family protein [Cellulomonas sp. HZM]
MRLPERSGDQRLIGVSITIPEPHHSALQEARARFGDPMASAIPPHITLLGPTIVEPEETAAVQAHLDAVAAGHAPFTVRLRGTGTFRPVSQVAFVQVADGIAGCEQLEQEVRSGPLDQELRFHYHPHVTVAHELADESLDEAIDELAEFDATFVVDSFECYVHDEGAWHVVTRHALGAEPAEPAQADEHEPRAV